MKFDAQIKQLVAANKDNPEAKQAIRDTLHIVELHIYDILKIHQSKRSRPLPRPQAEAGSVAQRSDPQDHLQQKRSSTND